MLKSSGDNVTDLLVRAHSDTAYFGVHPGFVFIDDGSEPYAYADPQLWVPDKPDGTVLLGVKFLAEVRRLQQGQTTFYVSVSSRLRLMCLAGGGAVGEAYCPYD